MKKESKNKKNTSYTIMLIPHSEKPSFSVKLPVYLFQGLAVLVVLFVIVTVSFVGSYLSLAQEASELEDLRETNREQKEKIANFAEQTKTLEEKMERVAETEEKVRELLDIEENGESEEGELLVEKGDEALKQLTTNGRGDMSFTASNTAERTEFSIRRLASELPEKEMGLEDLKEAAIKEEEERKHTPSIIPVHGSITSSYGRRNNPITGRREFHDGIDIAAGQGTPIRAGANGQVVYKGYRGGYGNLLIIDHGYGYQTYYAHLSSFNVDNGEYVEKEDVIGYVGRTGNSTGPHLHYEVHVNGSPVNPSDYIN
ncbi:M23 family metallopeptidase [Natranaerobius trueperi]|uniref:M23ase beta-sheet core domain-containing protein n=1 Tax=Natranaerobius trueperi TaxID=759412 RepID=A0A226BWZ8_9FIRM|nr:M23 family metallopeptidase [Natranaerobius trueperi]OWZ83485.1 hypothetical protein CDO51_08275 [Natranaerobius trueperi]